MKVTKPLPPEDLFVLLERAYRRKARSCDACVFTLPYRVGADAFDANWSVIPSAACTDTCRGILEDVVAHHQATYRLAAGRA